MASSSIASRFIRLGLALARPILGRGYFEAPIFRPLVAWVRRSHRREFVEIDGQRLYLNPKDTGTSSVSFELVRHGVHEAVETAIVRRLVIPGMTVVDLGANIGYFTLLFSMLAGEHGRVIALEPDRDNIALLRKTVGGLPHDNVEIIEAAAWQHNGTLDLYLSPDNPGDHRSYPSDEPRTHYQIPCVRVEDVVGERRVDFLKMDIQGAEGMALRGMARMFEVHPPRYILMEFWPSALASIGTPPDELFAWLVSLGYSIERVDYESMQMRPVSYDEIQQECDLDWKFVNLLCRLDGVAASR